MWAERRFVVSSNLADFLSLVCVAFAEVVTRTASDTARAPQQLYFTARSARGDERALRVPVDRALTDQNVTGSPAS